MSHPPITTLLYLQKTGLTWYDATTNQIAAMPITDDCIRDMEVVNPEQIDTQLSRLLPQQPPVASHAVLIIDTPLIFATTIATTAQSEEAIDEFLQLVPFDAVAETQIATENQTTVLATSQSLITTFRRILQKHNITLAYALPLGLYDTSNQQLNPLAAAAAQMMIDQAPHLAPYSLIPIPAPLKTAPAQADNQKEIPLAEAAQTHRPSYADADERKQPRTLKVLIPLFALLVIVLVGMLVWQRQPPTRPTQTIAQAGQPTQNTTPSTQSSDTAATQVNPSSVTVQVLAAQDGLERAKEIGATFSQAGFQVLPDTQQTAISTSQTIIFIDATYPKSLRDRVETLLQKHVQTYSVQEADSPTSGVTIILGSSE